MKNGLKIIQAAAYNGGRTVSIRYEKSNFQQKQISHFSIDFLDGSGKSNKETETKYVQK